MQATLPRTSFSYEYAAKGRAPCGASVLASFGIGHWPISRTKLSEMLSALSAAGYQHEKIYSRPSAWGAQLTLGQFMKDHPNGKFFLYVNSHFMSLIDGRLTDTDFSKGKSRRIIGAWQVW